MVKHMLNYLWAFMMLTGVLWGAFHGTMNEVTQGALESAKEAVSLCITMLGVMSLWTGILEIGQRAGLIEQISKKMTPVIKFLFPRIPEGHPAGQAIATNMIANVLGLGWAATPAGLRAMEELSKLEEKQIESYDDSDSRKQMRIFRRNIRDKESQLSLSGMKSVSKGTASNEMCTFLIINISSLQLIPVNMIAYRSQYGSVNPAAVVGPAIAATFFSTVVAVVFCKMMDRKKY